MPLRQRRGREGCTKFGQGPVQKGQKTPVIPLPFCGSSESSDRIEGSSDIKRRIGHLMFREQGLKSDGEIAAN